MTITARDSLAAAPPPLGPAIAPRWEDRETRDADGSGRAAGGGPDGARYAIPTREAPDRRAMPSRFLVKVNRFRLARFLLRELIHFRGRPHFKALVTSRPCVYGVFSGPVGGFAPRPRLCVGCLRCTTQHPEIIQILPNPAHARLGDDYLTAPMVDTILLEARTGAVPVRGQGYRGRMGGPGWDGMWTDMSEIVRPTRDGIHGRETISTAIDIGRRPLFLEFDGSGALVRPPEPSITLPLPILFDVPPAPARAPEVLRALVAAADRARTLAVVPLADIEAHGLRGVAVVPLLAPGDEARLSRLGGAPAMVEIDAGEVELNGGAVGGRDPAAGGRADESPAISSLAAAVAARFPEAIVAWRMPMAAGFEARLVARAEAGEGVFHLVADDHGRGGDGRFVLDLIRAGHQALMAAGLRDRVTLIGSGGIVAAEHVPKAIIAGLDGVAIDTAALVALQVLPRAGRSGRGDRRSGAAFDVGEGAGPLTAAWGEERLLNLLAAWRDQLLEILGAMGLREVRRLRGEIGRAMFQADLEREVFAGIEGFDDDA